MLPPGAGRDDVRDATWTATEVERPRSRELAPRPSAAVGRASRPAPAPQPQGIDPRALLAALRRRWRLALGAGLAAAAVASATTRSLVPPGPYTAKALVHVASRTPQVAFSTVDVNADAAQPLGLFKNTQLVLLRSRFVLGAAAKDPKIAALATVREHGNPAEWLEQELKVEFVDESEILRIALEGIRSDDLKAIVDAVARAYLDGVVNVERSRRLVRYDKLKSIYTKYQDTLQEKREALK
jgi:hypothetical protein